MTLIISMVWGNAVVITADSRASGGYVMHEERKLYPIYFGTGDSEIDLAIVSGAGDAALVKQGAALVEKEFMTILNANDEHHNPTLQELEQIVMNLESKLIDRYSTLRQAGINIETELLLASISKDGEPILYIFDQRGIANPQHKTPGYALLGSGSVTGGQLLLRLMDYSPELDTDRGMLSAFILDSVAEVDPSVSPLLGDSLLIRLDETKKKVMLGPLTTEALKGYKESVLNRRKMIQLVWRLAESVGDKETLTLLEEGMTKSNN